MGMELGNSSNLIHDTLILNEEISRRMSWWLTNSLLLEQKFKVLKNAKRFNVTS